MDNFYLFIKSLHIVSFTAWMAGMFYLPRLFVYHSEEKLDVNTYNKFLIMEKKLIRIIMTPAMIFTWILGFLLVLFAGQNQQDLIIALILPLYYIMDATLTLLKRVARREKIWEAHRSHFYQMVTNADKKTHRNTVFKITFCNVMLWGCAYGVYFIGAWALVPAVVIVSLLLLHFKLSALS